MKSLDEVRGLVRDRALKFENEGCYNCHYCGFDCRESCILQDVLLYLNDGAKDIDVPDKSATDICVGDNERRTMVWKTAEGRPAYEKGVCSCGYVLSVLQRDFVYCPMCGAKLEWGVLG